MAGGAEVGADPEAIRADMAKTRAALGRKLGALKGRLLGTSRPADHQGRVSQYLLQINGQREDILATFAADQLPLIGDCQVS